jgi:copper resistance protein B
MLNRTNISNGLAAISSALLLTLLPMAKDATGGCDTYQVKPLPTSYYSRFLMDRAEYVTSGRDDKHLSWEATGWISGEHQRLWLEAEGDHDTGSSEGGEIERLDLLHSRMLSPFWDARAGIGFMGTYGPGSRERFFAVLGLKGLAPYMFEIDSNLRLSDHGELLWDMEAEYEILITQRLVLQPRLDALWSFNRLGELDMGPGFASLSASLRLRYELTREFAPYLGISWNTMTGSTRDMARDHGEPRDTTRLFMGVRFWF